MMSQLYHYKGGRSSVTTRDKEEGVKFSEKSRDVFYGQSRIILSHSEAWMGLASSCNSVSGSTSVERRSCSRGLSMCCGLKVRHLN